MRVGARGSKMGSIGGGVVYIGGSGGSKVAFLGGCCTRSSVHRWGGGILRGRFLGL